jgi:predicted phage terminase large subunit-like protein
MERSETGGTALQRHLDEIRGQSKERVAARTTLEDWARGALPAGQVPAAHHTLLINTLRDVCDGLTDRLIVLMPPGSAKSTYSSVLFPAWWFSHHPSSNVIACSHTAALAGEFGGRLRGVIAEHGVQLGYTLGTQRSRHDFRTSAGGSYYAVGVHGGVTGRRADLILIDDPVRSQEDADSAQRREYLWNWYHSDLLTRLKPDGRIVLIMTRWHPDDLSGRLLEREPEWRCLRLPALAESDDLLGRAPGMPLWPAWEGAAMLERKRADMGERSWAAMFQQRPRPTGETLFKVSRIAVSDTESTIQSVRGWDLAATGQLGSGDPDWTVGLKLGREASGRFVVLHVVRFRGGPHEVEAAIVQAAERDGPDTLVSLPQDPGQAGKAQVRYLTSRLAGYHVHASRETGAKTTRAMPVASQIEAGNLALLHAPWNSSLLEELKDFPLGRKDDQIDALSRAFAELTQLVAPARTLGSGLMAR